LPQANFVKDGWFTAQKEGKRRRKLQTICRAEVSIRKRAKKKKNCTEGGKPQHLKPGEARRATNEKEILAYHLELKEGCTAHEKCDRKGEDTSSAGERSSVYPVKEP